MSIIDWQHYFREVWAKLNATCLSRSLYLATLSMMKRMKISDLGSVSRSIDALAAELIAPPDYNPALAPRRTKKPRRKREKRKTIGGLGRGRVGLAPFVEKILQITNDPRYTSIYWTQQGDSFVINKNTFEVSFSSSLKAVALERLRTNSCDWIRFRRSQFKPMNSPALSDNSIYTVSGKLT